MTFDEAAGDFKMNFAALGFDLDDLVSRKKILLSRMSVKREEILEVDQLTLDGLSIRPNHGIDLQGARRVMPDGIESLFWPWMRHRAVRIPSKLR